MKRYIKVITVKKNEDANNIAGILFSKGFNTSVESTDEGYEVRVTPGTIDLLDELIFNIIKMGYEDATLITL